MALVIYGSDISSLDAGGKFVTSEQSIASLYRRIAVPLKKAPAYIEVLLQTKLLDNVAGRYEIAAYRIPNTQ